MASGGCKKAAMIAGIGCIAVPIGLALVGALFVYLGSRISKREGPASPESTRVSIPLDGSPASTETGGAAPEASTPASEESAATGEGEAGVDAGLTASGPAPPGRDLPELVRADTGPLNLTLELEEGKFIIQPGSPGSDVKVDGYFDPRDYELTQETTGEGGSAGRSVRVRFRAKRGFLLRLFAGRLEDMENRVTVFIPPDVATNLRLRLSKCESHVELGGLTLTHLEARLSMGDQDLNVSSPTRGDLERADLNLSMGDIKIRGLGNAHPKEVTVRSSMGDIQVGLDGEWRPGMVSKARVRASMGDFRIRIPKSVRIASARTSISLGDSHGNFKPDQLEDPNAPAIDLELTASMGDIRVIRE